MFRIYDGRKTFWQWDLGQKLVVNFDCDEVHFSNGASANALVTKVYEQGGKKLVDVPDVLLQSAKSIKVYAYVVDGDDRHTEVKKVFPVLERTKPEDYVYTPDEIKTWEKLQDGINSADDKIGGLDDKIGGLDDKIGGLDDKIGSLSDLETEAKENLVAAINENIINIGGLDGAGAYIYGNNDDFKKLAVLFRKQVPKIFNYFQSTFYTCLLLRYGEVTTYEGTTLKKATTMIISAFQPRI